MIKKNITVNVDIEGWKYARDQHLNVSEICNKALLKVKEEGIKNG